MNNKQLFKKIELFAKRAESTGRAEYVPAKPEPPKPTPEQEFDELAREYQADNAALIQQVVLDWELFPTRKTPPKKNRKEVPVCMAMSTRSPYPKSKITGEPVPALIFSFMNPNIQQQPYKDATSQVKYIKDLLSRTAINHKAYDVVSLPDGKFNFQNANYEKPYVGVFMKE